MSKITFNPLHPNIGVEVIGFDIAKGFDQETLCQLTNSFVKHKVLLFRDQDISTEQYASFGRQWATTTRIDSFTEMHVSGFDDMNIIGNVGELFKNDEYRNGAAFWHTDCAAEADPDATTMLYCIEAPSESGETVIADMQTGYDTLDDQTRTELEPLIAHHCYAGAKPIVGGREDWEHTLTPVSDDTAKNFPPPVKRPVVRPHSVTGIKGLYAPAGSIFHIDGMDVEAAHELIRRVKQHVTNEKNCYFHKYRPGDILMWDNTSTMHFGKPTQAATGNNDRRLLYRMSPLGIPVGCTYFSATS